MAKRNRNGRHRELEGRALPVRLSKHIVRLGFGDPKRYFAWCLENGFSNEICKSWDQLEREWCTRSRSVAQARAREQVDRDPAKVLKLVISGERSIDDIARPRWRELAERFEEADLGKAEHRAFEILVEVATRRGNLLIAEARFGNEVQSILDGLLGLARAHERWLRDPRDWRPRSHNPKRQFAALARHLFAFYRVPGFLDAAWFRDDADEPRYQDWYVAIGEGRSIRNERHPILITRRIAHHLQVAPESLSIEQAVRWAQVHALGGDRVLADAVVSTPIGQTFLNEDFWVSVLRFFVEYPELDRAQFGPIVDFLQAQRFANREAFVAPGVRETIGPPQPNLSMNGRSPQSLLRAVDAWHKELARAGASAPNSQWTRSGLGEFSFEVGIEGRNQRVWRIRELFSSSELRHEGAVMRHCVAMYSTACEKGRASIWTMELHGFGGIEKRQTIEVNRDGVVVQCRGRFNRLPTEQELGIVRRWVQQEGLKLGNQIAMR